MTVKWLSEKLVLARYQKRRRGSNEIAVLDQDFQVRWNGVTIRVPIGFGTDLSSIPRVVPKWIASKFDGIEASVVHDWLYVSGEQSKYFADSLFYQMLADDPTVPWWRRELMYRAVRAFGKGVYDD